MSDLVSIIVPVFNAEETIKETIESVLSQTFPHWELILVNDGSTDNSLEVIKEYSDLRIKVATQINLGVSSARNLGITLATGNLIAFLDSDDLWSKDKLIKSVEAINSNDCAMVYSDVKIFYKSIDDSKDYKYQEPIQEQDCFLRLMIYDYIPTLTVVVKKSAFDVVGVFDTNLHGTEDWDLWLRIAKLYTVKYIPVPLSYYRYSEHGLSKKRDQHLIEEKKVLIKHVYGNESVPDYIQRKAEWVWTKKVFFNNLKEKRFFKAGVCYLKMIYLMPGNFYNFSMFWKRNG